MPGVSNDETDWLSTQEAARRLGITPRTLYRFIDHGELPAYRFGRSSGCAARGRGVHHPVPHPTGRARAPLPRARRRR